MKESSSASSPDRMFKPWGYIIGFAVVFLFVFAMVFHPRRIHGGTYRIRLVKADIAVLEQRIEAFRRIHGRLPSNQEGLSVLPELRPNARSSQRFVKGQTPKDPWGYEYQYVYPGKHNPRDYDLYSFGPDGRLGGDDEIGN